MSLSAISSAPSTAISTSSFHVHRKGAHGTNAPMTSASATSTSGPLGNTSGVTIGQMPISASSPLFSNILQSLQQTAGAQAATAATAPAVTATTAGTGTAAAATDTAGTTAKVQAFMHTLFQALKQDGLGSGASSGTAATASASTSATGTSSGTGQFNLVSSLQTLIKQVGSTAAATPATASLNAAYQSLTGGSSASSGGGLQNFLGNLMHNLQSGGVHSLSGVGNNVDANV